MFRACSPGSGRGRELSGRATGATSSQVLGTAVTVPRSRGWMGAARVGATRADRAMGVLRQYLNIVVWGKRSWNVALFLPFCSNKARQTAAKRDTKRNARIARICERWRTIRPAPANARKERLTLLFPPVNRRVVGSSPT